MYVPRPGHVTVFKNCLHVPRSCALRQTESIEHQYSRAGDLIWRSVAMMFLVCQVDASSPSVASKLTWVQCTCVVCWGLQGSALARCRRTLTSSSGGLLAFCTFLTFLANTSRVWRIIFRFYVILSKLLWSIKLTQGWKTIFIGFFRSLSLVAWLHQQAGWLEVSVLHRHPRIWLIMCKYDVIYKTGST